MHSMSTISCVFAINEAKRTMQCQYAGQLGRRGSGSRCCGELNRMHIKPRQTPYRLAGLDSQGEFSVASCNLQCLPWRPMQCGFLIASPENPTIFTPQHAVPAACPPHLRVLSVIASYRLCGRLAEAFPSEHPIFQTKLTRWERRSLKPCAWDLSR